MFPAERENKYTNKKGKVAPEVECNIVHGTMPGMPLDPREIGRNSKFWPHGTTHWNI